MAKPGISMQIVGLKELIKNLEEAGDRGKKAIGAGLYLESNNIISDSLRQVPVDFGTMKNSRYVTLPNMSGNNITVEMGYGGASSPYVVKQHEDTTLNHPGGGNAKFLERPLYSASASFFKNVTNYAAKAFQQNIGAKKISGIPDKPE